MPPPRKPTPADFNEVRLMCAGEDGTESPIAIARHYSQAGMPVDPRTVRRWITDLGKPTTTAPSEKQINDIIRAAGDDPKKVEVTKVRGMRYDTPHGEHTYVSVDWKPSLLALTPRPEGWKRPKVAPRKPQETELVVICGDQHAPEHDLTFHAKFLSWLAENRPSRIVILGDLLENSDVSRWADRKGEATAAESIQSAYNILRDYIHAVPDAQVTWIEGNHDQRIETYAHGNAGKVAEITRAGEDVPVLSLPHLMRLDELSVEYVTGYPLAKVILCENLAVIHGKIVKKGAGASALGNLEKRGYSVISGHTHRAGVVFKTVLDIDDTPSTLMGAETGTMKEIKPEVFDEAPDHQNAFVTATIWQDGQFHLDPAIYSAGSLRWRDQRF